MPCKLLDKLLAVIDVGMIGQGASYGLDLGNGDLPALAQVQNMKQANLIERDFPQRKSSGAGLCEVLKVSLSGFDERRGPVSLERLIPLNPV